MAYNIAKTIGWLRKRLHRQTFSVVQTRSGLGLALASGERAGQWVYPPDPSRSIKVAGQLSQAAVVFEGNQFWAFGEHAKAARQLRKHAPR